MTTTTGAHLLRQRAATLRGLAARLHHLDALELVRRAGSDTWLGPSAAACRDELLALRRDLQRRADELLAVAHRLELRADEQERIAAITGPR